MLSISNDWMHEMERVVAVKVMKYCPLYDKGMYGFKRLNVAGTVQFNPFEKLDDAFCLLEQLETMGYEWQLKFDFKENRYTLSVMNRLNYEVKVTDAVSKCLVICQTVYEIAKDMVTEHDYWLE